MKEFNTDIAFIKLSENRKEYIKMLIEYVTKSVEKENYEMASNYIVLCGNNLTMLNGALDYLEAFNNEGAN